MRIATLFLTVLAFGCGKKDESSGQPPPAPTTKPTDPPVAPAGKPADPAPAPAPAPPANPECKLEITGAETKTIEGRGGISAVSTSYWYKADDKAGRTLWPSGLAGFLANCMGQGASVNILTKDATPETFKLGPRKYELGDNFGTHELSIVGSVAKASIVGAKGTVEITAFDTSHIAGKVDLTAKLLPGDGQIKIVGEFDFKCPQVSGCGQ
ncbi:MAG: hypothetical protein ACKV2T_40070 [Kofleriaceae bacterium]